MASKALIDRLPGKLGDALFSTLATTETILVSMHTAQGEGLVVTDRRTIVLKAGLYANAGISGKKAISYAFRDISSVEHREGIVGGHVKILVAGVLESSSSNFAAGNNSYWGKNRESENVVTYEGRDMRDLMREAVSIIQERMELAHAPAVPSRSSETDLASQLLKLEELRKAGVLSEEEFSAAKKRVIEV
ncbi:MAG: hypothetical protein JWM87_3784 [Candidatus Eremiobacteraeota bacterium]|nr:hypothetical protein [Candidatus Eremiobacteraeota bacterium]